MLSICDEMSGISVPFRISPSASGSYWFRAHNYKISKKYSWYVSTNLKFCLHWMEYVGKCISRLFSTERLDQAVSKI